MSLVTDLFLTGQYATFEQCALYRFECEVDDQGGPFLGVAAEDDVLKLCGNINDNSRPEPDDLSK